MKRICLFVGSTLFLTTLIAGDIIPADGKEWVIKTQIVYPNAPTTIHKMWIEGDTVIMNRSCKKLHILSLRENEQEIYAVEYCRQDGDKFYRGDVFLFDFGLQQGERFQINEGTDLIVTHVGDTILSDGVTRKCLTVNPCIGNHVVTEVSDFWVEGLGSLKMGIYDNDFYIGGMLKELLYCTHNNTPIYEKGEENSIDTFHAKMSKCLITFFASTLHCTSPDAIKVEVYTMDAVKVGEARFVGGEASVKIGKTPATYLYIVTYPDGRRESGKVLVNEE